MAEALITARADSPAEPGSSGPGVALYKVRSNKPVWIGREVDPAPDAS